MLHCPLNAPLAVRPVSKSGSLSVARWILQIDAPKARDLSLMASTWRPFEADRELYFDWASRWVSNRRTGSDPREQDAKDMALRSRFGQESSGVILAASASSCLSLRGASFPLKLCIKTNIYIYISIHVIYYYSIIYLPSYYIYIYILHIVCLLSVAFSSLAAKDLLPAWHRAAQGHLRPESLQALGVCLPCLFLGALAGL